MSKKIVRVGNYGYYLVPEHLYDKIKENQYVIVEYNKEYVLGQIKGIYDDPILIDSDINIVDIIDDSNYRAGKMKRDREEAVFNIRNVLIDNMNVLDAHVDVKSSLNRDDGMYDTQFVYSFKYHKQLIY